MSPRILSLSLALLAGCASTTEPAPKPVNIEEQQNQVWETELAFAATMANRDHGAFATFLSEDAIFYSGAAPLRGKAAVAEGWAPYFTQEAAPFSWEPDSVEVLPSGGLALSTGPVFNGTGAVIGRFNSIWRLEGEAWRVVFDKGEGE